MINQTATLPKAMTKERQDVPPLRLGLPVGIPNCVRQRDDLEEPPRWVDL